MAEAKIGAEYNEDSIRSLDWKEHIRLRPGMYIGKLGDGSAPDDGIYVLMKEVIDNCIDEHTMGYGKQIEESGVEFFAHKTGFTHNSLLKSLLKAGFVHIHSSEGNYSVTAIGFKKEVLSRSIFNNLIR
jgi:hypothetical protein